jgi:hypothetical protein
MTNTTQKKVTCAGYPFDPFAFSANADLCGSPTVIVVQPVQHRACDYPACLRRPMWQHPWRRDALRNPLVRPRRIEVGNVFLQDANLRELTCGIRGVYHAPPRASNSPG